MGSSNLSPNKPLETFAAVYLGGEFDTIKLSFLKVYAPVAIPLLMLRT